MASNGPSPHSPSLRLGLPAPQPSRRHHAQSLLWAPHSWPKNASCSRIPPRASRASLPPRRWAMPCHRLSLRPCTAPLSVSAYNTSSSCRLWVLDHLCFNLSQSFHPISLLCALAFPPPSHRDATTLRCVVVCCSVLQCVVLPCWAPTYTHTHSYMCLYIYTVANVVFHLDTCTHTHLLCNYTQTHIHLKVHI